MIRFDSSPLGTPEQLEDSVPSPVLVGTSGLIDRLRQELRDAATTDGPVLISGERGTGKSLVARALHEMGRRTGRHCVVIACDTASESVLERELFGCAPDAGVGAPFDRRGALEMADGGTVILENIDAAGHGTRAALERFRETGRVHRVGSAGPGIPVDTRIVATKVRVRGESSDDSEHRSAYSGLAATCIHVPNLRERRMDIPALCEHFAMAADERGRGVAFSAEAMQSLCAYPWPGNVAQLRGVVQWLVSSVEFGYVRPSDLPVGLRPRSVRARGQLGRRTSVGEALYARLRASGEGFWSSVYPLFMKREITRRDLRDLLRKGLEATQGDREGLLHVLNMKPADRRRFDRFLRKYDCAVAALIPGAKD